VEAPSLADRIAQAIAREAELDVVVTVRGRIVHLDGVVDSPEDRQAAADVARRLAGGLRVVNDLEIETLLPVGVDAFAGSEPSAELAEDADAIAAAGGQVDPEFEDQPLLTDALAASGPTDSEDDLVSEGGAVYVPPTDPVAAARTDGGLEVLGGYSTTAEPDASATRRWPTPCGSRCAATPAPPAWRSGFTSGTAWCACAGRSTDRRTRRTPRRSRPASQVCVRWWRS
jgi:hypothetical protein